MDLASPTKRRAALAPIDANANAAKSPASNNAPGTSLKNPRQQPSDSPAGSPTKLGRAALAGVKRPLHVSVASDGERDENGVAKKQCQAPQGSRIQPSPRPSPSKTQAHAQIQTQAHGRVPWSVSGEKEQQERDHDRRQRSTSPDASSVFDNSATEASSHDTTQDTAITEPDMLPAVAAAVVNQVAAASRSTPAAVSGGITREEARQRAETLRLRLGLANYKLRTGQADVPLDRLQMRPMPGAQSRGRWSVPLAAAASTTTAHDTVVVPGGGDGNSTVEDSGNGSSESRPTGSQGWRRNDLLERRQETEPVGSDSTTAAITAETVPVQAPALAAEEAEARPAAASSPSQDATASVAPAPADVLQRIRDDGGRDELRGISGPSRGGAADGLLDLSRSGERP